MARILLGVSGGIAAYKALELVRLATAAGHALRVVQTPASRRFVGSDSFAALTGAPVLVSEFERDPARGSFPGQRLPAHDPLSHLELVANAHLYVIAPASANTIAKLAAGLADNLVCACALAADGPLVVAPAMNSRMYEHPATQQNLGVLRERGAEIVEPAEGRLASHGEEGVGRLAEPARILATCEQALALSRGHPIEGRTPQGGTPHGGAYPMAGHRQAGRQAGEGADGSLAGVRVLVTAGGTREPIDSVRFIGNNSSGRMGIALAAAARRRGATVTLVCANVALPAPSGVARTDVSSAAQLQAACEREFPSCEVLLMAAAVADFAPQSPGDGKIKKSGSDGLSLKLMPTADILAGLGARRRAGQTLIGFAAEHGPDAMAQAEGKLAAKHLDALVVNDIAREDIGFDSECNEVTILSAARDARLERVHVSRTSKENVAEAVLDAVERLRGRG